MSQPILTFPIDRYRKLTAKQILNEIRLLGIQAEKREGEPFTVDKGTLEVALVQGDVIFTYTESH